MQFIRKIRKKSQYRAVGVAVFFVAFVCFALLGANGWVIFQTKTQKIDQLNTSNENLASALAQQLESVISEVSVVLDNDTYELEREVLDDRILQHLQPVIVNQATVTQHIEDIFIYDRSGACILSTQATLPSLINNSDREYFLHHRDNPSASLFIGRPIVSRSTKDWIMTVSKRFNDGDGNFGGVITASIRIDHLSKILSNFQIGSSGAINFLRNDGQVLVRRPFAEDDLTKNFKAIPESALFNNNIAGSMQLVSPFDGVLRLVSYRKLTQYPLLVTVALSRDEMLADWRATSFFQSAWVLGLCITAVLVGSYMIRSIREQLRTELRLARASKKLMNVNKRLEELVRVDALTGLANRRCFDERLKDMFAESSRSRQPLTLAMIDVDHFKHYNDLYGHPAGDKCLQNVAQAIQSVARRPTDFVARYGGEEMVMILSATDEKGSLFVAEAACKAVESLKIPHALSGAGHVTVSVGIATYFPAARSDMSSINLLTAADQSLYQAKAQGRNRVVASN